MSLANKLLSMLNESTETQVVSEAKNPEYSGLSLPEYFDNIFNESISYVNISLDESNEDESLITHTVVNGVPFTFKFSVNEDKPVLTISTSSGETVSEKTITLSKKMLNAEGDLVIEENMAYMPTDKIHSVVEKLSEKATVSVNFVYTDKDGNAKSVTHNVNERMTGAEKMAAKKRAARKEKLGIVSMAPDAKTLSDITKNLQQIGVNGVVNSIEAQMKQAEQFASGKFKRNGKTYKVSPENKIKASKKLVRLEKLKAAVEANKAELLQKYGAEGKKGEQL